MVSDTANTHSSACLQSEQRTGSVSQLQELHWVRPHLFSWTDPNPVKEPSGLPVLLGQNDKLNPLFSLHTKHGCSMNECISLSTHRVAKSNLIPFTRALCPLL